MKRRDVVPEEERYLGLSIDELAELRRRLIAAGTSIGTVNGMVGWLVAKGTGSKVVEKGGDAANQVSQARYRRILRELDTSPAPAPTPARARRLRAVGEAGRAATSVKGSAPGLGVLVSGMAASLAMGSPVGAIVGAAAYLTERGEPGLIAA